MLGRDLNHRLEPELIELTGSSAGPFVVGLVDRHDDRDIGRPQSFGNLLVSRNEPLAPIHHEHHDLSHIDCPLPRDDDQLVQRIFARAKHAAGIDEREGNSLPLSGLRDHIARRPGNWRDDRAPGVGDSVEKG